MGWMDELEDAMSDPVLLEAPEGYSSVTEIAEKMNVSAGTARRRLLDLYRAGKIKRILVRPEGMPGSAMPYYED